MNNSLNDVAYMVSPSPAHSRDISTFDWLLDSACTSHICTQHDAFSEYHAVNDVAVKGLGPGETSIVGRGTVTLRFDFDGKTYLHQLRNTVHIPNGANCLLSLGKYDDSGGKVEFAKGTCWSDDWERNQAWGTLPSHRESDLTWT